MGTLLFLQDPTAITDAPESMTIGHWIAIAAIIVPVVGFLIWRLIRAIYRTGEITENIKHINTDVHEMKESVKLIPVLVDRVNALWLRQTTVSKSPMMLNEYGNEILTKSKIDTLTDTYYKEIVEKVKARNPENAYQAQQIIIEEIRDYKEVEKCKSLLEQAAFNSGTDVDTVLLVAAINIRDKMLYDLKLNRDDIDKFDPEKNKPKV